ncbi:HNH endonuclease [Sphaerospermopsis torques-reginae]|uniref:HNH endonuclease n=1 Tax=Sphaerospermopsis torques-reginae ITEP-024 TaxID=984208 RepID=A0ABX8X2D3_9CYAN|nr:HNH endonuclease [Sphaerospermopsis torques-reginae]QYX32865.1 HNH endonuclease [Sphaerospermopsis torques-reginae ITEP-024]
MRPIQRGSIPTDPTTGQKIVFSKHPKAKSYLIERIGNYCSYCEKRVTQLFDVEHILSQHKYPQLKTNWYNFLLLCRVCNDIKGHSLIRRKNFYWADVDNTFRIFEYHPESGDINVNSLLSDAEKAIAKNTLDLVGLDRKPGHPKYKPTSADLRWKERLVAVGIAQEAFSDLQKNDTPEMRKQIVRTAQGIGFFSVWMTVFKDDPEMIKRFIAAFPGTAGDCFDHEGKPIHRPKGRV